MYEYVILLVEYSGEIFFKQIHYSAIFIISMDVAIACLLDAAQEAVVFVKTLLHKWDAATINKRRGGGGLIVSDAKFREYCSFRYFVL